MPNTIVTAVNYTNNAEVINKLYQASSTTGSWEKKSVFIGARTVKYLRVGLSSYVLGTYNRETGYTAKNIETEWLERNLTQDKGDSLYMDKMDNEESNADTLTMAFNRYKRTVEIPSLDTYRYSAVHTASGTHKTTTQIQNASDLVSALNADITYLRNKFVANDLELRISATMYGLLEDTAFNKGSLQIGDKANLSTDVITYKGARVIVVPDDILGCEYILCDPICVTALRKYQETVYFDKVPGYGNRKMEIDTGVYHDCFIEPQAEQFVCVHKYSA